MQEPLANVVFLIVVVTGVVSAVAFRRPDIQSLLMFWPEAILGEKQFYRLFTPCFIHADWMHLLFNMFSLYVFGSQIELHYGPEKMALIYFSSIIGGGLLSLWIHRRHDYRALGASGGVCGIIFASIFLFPGGNIYMFPLPFGIPAWLYAIVFLLASFYGMRSGAGNVGHDHHLGGALVGLLTTTVLYPEIVRTSTLLFFAVMGISLVMFLHLVVKPSFVPLELFKSSWTPTWRRRRRRLPAPKLMRSPHPREREMDLDAILDKISKSGMQSLTPREHEFLLEASKRK